MCLGAVIRHKPLAQCRALLPAYFCTSRSHLSSISCFLNGVLQMSLRGSEAQPMGLALRRASVAPLNTFSWNSSYGHSNQASRQHVVCTVQLAGILNLPCGMLSCMHAF